MKQCTKCNEVKPLSEFYRATASLDGYFSQCKTCQHAYQRATRKPRNPTEQKSAHLKRTFNLTRDEYDAMRQAQTGLCASCGRPETRTNLRNGDVLDLAVDHDHVTGQVRALLCSSCNIALGLLQDDPERIEQLLRYIQRFQ